MKTQDKINSNFSSERTLEITYWIIGILMVVFLLAGSNIFAYNPPETEESYIDDIPFDTEKVVDEMIMPALDFDDELYIDDIPFNTAKVIEVSNSNISQEIEFVSVDEAYINDLPFSTELVVAEYEYQIAVSQVYYFKDEKYINDIPFSTYLVAKKAIKDMESNLCMAL
jgi:hypothetical protein